MSTPDIERSVETIELMEIILMMGGMCRRPLRTVSEMVTDVTDSCAASRSESMLTSPTAVTADSKLRAASRMGRKNGCHCEEPQKDIGILPSYPLSRSLSVS